MDDIGMDLSQGTGLSEALSEAERALLAPVGFAPATSRSGAAVVVDQGVRFTGSWDAGVEILPLTEALAKYDFVQDLMFGLIKPDENDTIRQASELVSDPVGYFIYVHDGAKVSLPVETFTLMETPQRRQFTHNVTLIGEGAEVEMISGAAVPQSVHAGHHISIEETYVRAGARCRSIAIESWGSGMTVESYSRTDVGEGAEQTSNQIMLAPIKQHHSDTKSSVGANAICNDQAIIFAPSGTERTFVTETRLTGAGARSESVARMVSAGGTIRNDAVLIGDAGGSSGFLGCDGLKLSDEGSLIAIPSLVANAEGAQLSHEASVGMVSGEKLDYLMAAGLSEDAARDLIVQGFLNLKDQYIPAELRAQVHNMIAAAKTGGM